ncbi:MAG: potassium transporter TrkG [Duodenibacillus sp.]|nr:potassium transporter TrkG [Duodenibacillus sp.]
MLHSLRYILFPVLNITAPVLIAFSFIMLLPCVVSFIYEDGAAGGFQTGAVICFFTGVFLLAITRKDRRELMPRDGFLLATIIWVAIPLFASIPLYLEIPGINFTYAFFEAMSGTTTTCASVLDKLDLLPQSINFWRCFLSWLGGMGILVLAVAILPALGVGGSQIFKAEFSGPMKEARLTPRIADTAKGLWSIYLVLSVACAAAFRLAGMDAFDSILHAFSTVSLGGFSSHDASYGYFNNVDIEMIGMFFMTICGISFSLHFIAWRSRSPVAYFKSPECRAWLITVALMVALVTAILYDYEVYDDPLTALRYAAFNTISIISTSGFSTADFSLWPAAAPFILFSVACFATCGGSTGGGMKMMRAIILLKQLSRQFTLTLYPKAIESLTVGGVVVGRSVIFSAMAFMVLWLIVSIVITLALMVTGLDITTAISATVACVTNLGPGLGIVGPLSNYSVLTDVQLWMCTFLMLLGRLELVTVFVLFTRTFWRF